MGYLDIWSELRRFGLGWMETAAEINGFQQFSRRVLILTYGVANNLAAAGFGFDGMAYRLGIAARPNRFRRKTHHDLFFSVEVEFST